MKAITSVPIGLLDTRYLKLDASNDPITGDLLIKPTTDSLTGFVVQDTDANAVLTVDTINNSVGIGVAAPTSKLHVKGSSSVATVGTNTLLTADGSFTTNAGWTLGAAWTIGSGVATKAAGTTTLAGTSDAKTTSVVYQVNFDVTVTVAGDGFSLSLGGKDSGTVFTTSGTPKTVYIVPSSTTGTLLFTPGAAGTFTGTIDNVTIFAITPSVPDAVIESSNGTGTPVVFRAGGHNLYNMFAGNQAGSNNTIGLRNVFLGCFSGQFNTDGSDNIFIGYAAGYFNVTSANVFIGRQAGYSTTTGSSNVFVGYQAGFNNITGNNNVFVGLRSGFTNTVGVLNVFLGHESGYSNTSGEQNTFVGYRAGYYNTTSLYNVFSGFRAGFTNTSGSANVFEGFEVGYSNSTGYSNVFSGFRAGYQNSSGYQNVFSGYESGYSNTSGYQNVFSGYQAGYSNATGFYNTFLGFQAGIYNVSGSSNVFLGFAAGFYETGSNTLFIDNAPRASEADARVKALMYGIFDAAIANQKLNVNATLSVNGSVGIGTTSPYSLTDISSTTGGILTLSRADTSVTAADLIGQIDFHTTDTQTTTNPIAAEIKVSAANTISTDINPGIMDFLVTGTGVAGALIECMSFRATTEATIGMYGVTPVVRAAHIANPTDLATCITSIKSILTALENIGILKTA